MTSRRFGDTERSNLRRDAQFREFVLKPQPGTVRIHFKQHMLAVRPDDPIRSSEGEVQFRHQSIELLLDFFGQFVGRVAQTTMMGAPVDRIVVAPRWMVDPGREVPYSNCRDPEFKSGPHQVLKLAGSGVDGFPVVQIRGRHLCREDELLRGIYRHLKDGALETLVDDAVLGSGCPNPGVLVAGCDERVSKRYAQRSDDLVLRRFDGSSSCRPVGIEPSLRLHQVKGASQCLLDFPERERSEFGLQVWVEAWLPKASKPGGLASIKAPPVDAVVQRHARFTARAQRNLLLARIPIDIQPTGHNVGRQRVDNGRHVRVDRRPDHQEVGTSDRLVDTQVSASSVSLRYVPVSSAPIFVLPVGIWPSSPATAKRLANTSTPSDCSDTMLGSMVDPSVFGVRARCSHQDPKGCRHICLSQARTSAEQLVLPVAGASLADLVRVLYAQDRQDRVDLGSGHLPVGLLDARDDDRVRRLRRAMRDDHDLSPYDSYRAAMVFQHGRGAGSIRWARRLALRAARGGVPEARHLAAASLDRRLMYEGRPQRYGTQYRRHGGRWHLWTVRSQTSDRERRNWKVPCLAEALRLADSWNETGS